MGTMYTAKFDFFQTKADIKAIISLKFLSFLANYLGHKNKILTQQKDGMTSLVPPDLLRAARAWEHKKNTFSGLTRPTVLPLMVRIWQGSGP